MTTTTTTPAPATVVQPAVPPAQQVTLSVSDGLITLTATGRVDRLTAATFREDLFEVWPVCAGTLTVDLSGCTYLSVDAIRALQDIWRRPTRARGELRVIAGHPDVATALDTANIPRLRAVRV